MLYVAHRGLWFPDHLKQNTLEAWTATLEHGYALEVDVRTNGVALLVQHDEQEVPKGTVGRYLTWLAVNHPEGASLFWDVKDAGAVGWLPDVLRAHEMTPRSYLFDLELVMDGKAIEGEVALLREPRPRLLCRASDRGDEPLARALACRWADGIWLDAFERDWVTEQVIQEVHAAGKQAHVVSQELHGRTVDIAWWLRWREADGIVTDFPHLLQAVLEGHDPVHPKEPWWD